MNCPRLWQVEASRDGRLPREEAVRFRRHAETCATCTQERVALEQLAVRLRGGSPALDDVATRRLKQRVLEGVDALVTERTPAPRRSRKSALVSRGAPTRIAATLAVAAALGGGAYLARSRAPRQGETPSIVIVPSASGAQWTRATTPTEERVVLSEGTLHLTIRRTGDQRRVTVVVPDGEIEDIGTSFDVTVEHGRTTSVHVSEGRIVVHAVGRDAVAVQAGSTWQPPPPAASADLAAPPSPADGSDGRAGGASDPATFAHAGNPSAVHAVVAAPGKSAASPSAIAASDEDGEDAAYLNLVALAREGRNAEARIAAKSYLQKYPSGFRRVEVEALAR